ncbi:MAG: DUF2127 domain-containing protein [Deltaproteobacteria bacterium]|nr:DUF2127 domain-containing protein [Deltaproteobacteria bacterium]
MHKPERFNLQSLAHVGFEVGVLLKGLNGVVEVLGGMLLFVMNPRTIRQTLLLLTHEELLEDPGDLVGRLLLRLAEQLTVSTQVFAGFYLVSHGVIKVLLIAALLRRKLWAYPAAIVVFALFGAYQMYRYAVHPSAVMIVLTVVDLAVMVLTWVEYLRLRPLPPVAEP